MKRTSLVLSVLASALALSLAAGRIADRPTMRENAVPTALTVYEQGLSRLDDALVALDAALATGARDSAVAAFRGARRAYKRVEVFTEYYGGGTARELNAPTIPKAEDEDPETPLAPVGLQMIEAALHPGDDRSAIVAARRFIPYMRIALRSLRRAGLDSMPGDAYVFDAARHELARVSTLGLAGFDATLSGDADRESADALDGIRLLLQPYARPGSDARTELRALDSALAATAARLRGEAGAGSIERIDLLAHHLVPAAHRLAEAQRALGVAPPDRPRAWSARSASPYDAHAFDARFFAATDAPAVTPELVALGRSLFFDADLSPSGKRSCATCHLPERAFTDGLPRASLIAGHGSPRQARNTPTLINTGLQPTLFADGRVRTLEDQATDVIGSAGEMGGSLGVIATRLAARPDYLARFARVTTGPSDSAVAARAIRSSLAAYVRSLVRLDARFDRAVRGDPSVMTPVERRGFDLFMGKARCGTCHFPPLFGGAMPPALTENEPEVIGVPSTAVQHHARIDPDSGRFNVRRIGQHLHAFKTPALRNVALTAPYMHNGVYRTLDQVLDFYDAGGGHGIGADLPHQTLSPDSLHLDVVEKRAIGAFLRSLTDTTATTARPVAARRMAARATRH